LRAYDSSIRKNNDIKSEAGNLNKVVEGFGKYDKGVLEMFGCNERLLKGIVR
jgi:hypothetical protein